MNEVNEQKLCALGTVGAAAAGLAFGTDPIDSPISRNGKRKWPGSTGNGWMPSSSDSPALSRRSISQPNTPILPAEPPTLSPQLTFSSRLSSAPRLFGLSREDSFNQPPSSRGSSTSRRSILRPRTSASRTTTENRESSTSSTWLKRLSSFSSHTTSTAASVSYQGKDESILPPTTASQRPYTSAGSIPNKLVKRSVSHRGLSHDEAQGQILRRPATSHQRSQTFKEILSRPISQNINGLSRKDTLDTTSTSNTANTSKRSWRPFFETAFPRKRRRSESTTDSSQIRVISMSSTHNPVMLLGSQLDDSACLYDSYDHTQPLVDSASGPSITVRKARRSLNSLRRATRRRNFTDPSVQLTRTAVVGAISPVKVRGQISSTTTNDSGFHIDLPIGTPQFTSSPPLSQYDRGTPFRLRNSITVSDPPTTNSDADARVFSDDESLDFKSDTAYDSIATRTTNASHSGQRDSKLETIFAARTSDESYPRPKLWQNLDHEEMPCGDNTGGSPFHNNDVEMQGMGITMTDIKTSSFVHTREDALMTTPPRSASIHSEDFSVTPVPMNLHNGAYHSSPPLLPVSAHTKEYDQVGDMLEDMKLDDPDEPAWSVNSDSDFDSDSQFPTHRQAISSAGSAAHHLMARFQESELSNDHTDVNGKTQQPSIFDWSEHQQNGSFPRPKTVHGKQSNGDRSRSSGRKGDPQLHFRSQSVPVNCDGPSEDAASTTKFQTWRLGYKPVSEEWSDDFDFDDAEDVVIPPPAIDDTKNNFRGSVRSVKIPQTIIDRQSSVHLQFGQVQEFMALVEELKRLRSTGASLDILSGNARHLWEDAESIINLATINDNEDSIAPIVTPSPPSSDPFAEMVPIQTTQLSANRGRRPTTTGRRSVSAMTTPPIHGRARGESLAQARHLLQAIHQNRSGFDSSPKEIELHHQRKLPFDTQDLKDLVVRSGVITRALKEEVRRAEGVSISPQKASQSKKDHRDRDDHPLNELFRIPEPEASPCPPLRKPGLPKSRSANSWLESSGARQYPGPFSSPIALATVM